MKNDNLFQGKEKNDYSRSNHFSLQSESKIKGSINLEKEKSLNSLRLEQILENIFFDNLPIEEEVKQLVKLYEEKKKELVSSSFYSNRLGVFYLHEEGKSYLNLLEHIIDDYAILKNASAIKKYALEAMQADLSDTLEFKKYLAFSFLSLDDNDEYKKLKENYSHDNFFLFTNCIRYILNKEFLLAFSLLEDLKKDNNWIVNFLLYGEYKNILSIFRLETSPPKKIIEAINFIICSFLINKTRLNQFILFASKILLNSFALSNLNTKFLVCFASCLNNGEEIISSSSLFSLNKNNEILYNWLINQKGNSMLSAFEILTKKGIIYLTNSGYKFTYVGNRILKLVSSKNFINKLFK